MKNTMLICTALVCAMLCTACGETDTPVTTDTATTVAPIETTAAPVTTEAPVTTAAPVETTPLPETTAAPVETTAATTTEASTTTAPNVLQYTPLGENELKKRMAKAKQEKSLCIVIDPGHGLVDPGAVHEKNLGKTTEAELTMIIAQRLATALEARGYKTVLTHDGKTKPYTEYDDGKLMFGPSERCGFSNAQDAHLFISLHCDAYPQSTSVSGTRIYYPVDTPNSTKYDKEFANVCKKALETAFPDAKKVSLMDMHGTDCYTVIYKTVVPSILVECGFITNKDDAAKLLDPAWQQTFAEAMATGVDAFFN